VTSDRDDALGAVARGSLVAVLGVLVLGCPPAIDEGGHGDASLDTPPPVYVPVADETLDRFVDVLALIASVDWAFGERLDEHSRLFLPTAADRRLVIEGGLASTHLVDDPRCASATWEGERATVVLDSCLLGISGRRARGALRLEVSEDEVSIALEGLVVRDTTLDGTITLRALEGPSMGTRGLWGSVQYPDVEGTTTLTFTGSASFVSFTPLHEDGVTPVLQGSWSGASGTSDFFVQASFVPGDCLPSDGYALFSGAPFASETRLAFGLSTPDDHRWGRNTLSCE
jgi:hypothetical protein